MARKQTFLRAQWSKVFSASYARLSTEQQKRCDEAMLALIKQQDLPGLRIKPILPSKIYNEARINSGDRLIFRIEADTVYFVDVVEHDHIKRYGKR